MGKPRLVSVLPDPATAQRAVGQVVAVKADLFIHWRFLPELPCAIWRVRPA